MRLRRLLLILLCFVSVSVFPQGKKADTEALGRALEYFQSQKYHEALLIFQRLDQSYKLNARYKAYIGLCYYYDWDYKKATEYFDTFLPKLDMLAPEERALYYYADGESHFQLGHYDQAILLFQSALALCHDRDKGDSWFRIGFCYYFLQQPALAQGCFLVAEYYYATFRNSPDLQARRQPYRDGKLQHSGGYLHRPRLVPGMLWRIWQRRPEQAQMDVLSLQWQRHPHPCMFFGFHPHRNERLLRRALRGNGLVRRV